MKKYSLITLIAILFCASIYANDLTQTTDSLLRVLDKTIRNKQKYTDEKEAAIAQLNQWLRESPTDKIRYDLLGVLFEEYKSYQLDSAYAVAVKRADTADRLQEDSLQVLADMNMSEILSMTGMYSDALDILNRNRAKIHKYNLKAYNHHLYHSIYMLMSNNSISKQQQRQYIQLIYQYKDSILSVNKPADIGYILVEGPKLMMENKYDEALKYMLDLYDSCRMDTHQTAITAAVISDIYDHIGDVQNEKKYLAISAINDIKGSVKEYISLRQLAILLFNEGDIDRAYLYMKCAMEDAIFCNARLRTLEVSQMLPIINASYDQKMQQDHNRLVFLVIIMSVMAIGLIVALMYIYKQLKALASARRKLKAVNVSLTQMNDDLSNLNSQLSETNHVKEEYIGYLFNMCSAYIDKFEDFRKTANRKLKAGQAEDLYKITSDTSLMNEELKEFYGNFDTIFLNLYPNFVSEFNSLLQKDEEILPKEGELLTPELRIFALVRLGINDSVKIASFLHYSAQTVYNYRLKVRNKAIIPKEDFPEAVRQIGQLKIQ